MKRIAGTASAESKVEVRSNGYVCDASCEGGTVPEKNLLKSTWSLNSAFTLQVCLTKRCFAVVERTRGLGHAGHHQGYASKKAL